MDQNLKMLAIPDAVSLVSCYTIRVVEGTLLAPRSYCLMQVNLTLWAVAEPQERRECRAL
jgi:hypothetical protein